MHEPIRWRSLTFQWDTEQSLYVCGRWSLAQPQGKWRALWSAGALGFAGKSSPLSPADALESLRLDLQDKLESLRMEARVTLDRVGLIGGDLDSLERE